MDAYRELAGLVTFRPLEQPVTEQNRYSPFRASWTNTVDLLADELRHHGAKHAVCEIGFHEHELRLDGLPRASARAHSSGIVLSFKATSVPGEPHLRYEVGTYSDWQSNIRAVALGLRDLRAVDRHGVTKRGEQYAGWRALTAGSAAPSASRGEALIAKHGSLAAALKATHPDTGVDANKQDFEDVMAAKQARG